LFSWAVLVVTVYLWFTWVYLPNAGSDSGLFTIDRFALLRDRGLSVFEYLAHMVFSSGVSTAVYFIHTNSS